MAAILELRGVSKHYPAHRAVHEVSLEVETGAFYSILGPSGCGKTTTLRLIAGFEDPDHGEILLDGRPLQNIPPFERPVNTVFQRYALFPHLTVQGNVEFGLKRRGVDHRAKVAEALEMVHLTGKEQRMPAQLSGGEQQRVALARSLVLEPRVLLLDEPLSALDPALRKSVRAELKTLQRGTGITFVFITHDQEEALSLSDRIAVMNKGEVEQIGSPQDIYLRPATPFVATFLGDVNWIDSSATLGVRPEATSIGRQAPEVAAARVESGRVRNSVFLGHCFHVETETSRGRIVAEAAHAYTPGEAVFVWWNAADEMRFHA